MLNGSCLIIFLPIALLPPHIITWTSQQALDDEPMTAQFWASVATVEQHQAVIDPSSCVCWSTTTTLLCKAKRQ